MTDSPRRLSPDEVLFGAEVLPAAEREKQPVTEGDVLKAQTVIRALIDGGKKSPFDFNPEEAKFLWAIKLRQFPLDVAIEAANEIVSAPGTEWPGLGDVEQLARLIIAERTREEREAEAQVTPLCGTCEGTRWIRVYDGTGTQSVGKGAEPGTHMEECPDCPVMAERRDIMRERKHGDQAHIDRGGCPTCWKYTPSLHHRIRAQRSKARS